MPEAFPLLRLIFILVLQMVVNVVSIFVSHFTVRQQNDSEFLQFSSAAKERSLLILYRCTYVKRFLENNWFLVEASEGSGEAAVASGTNLKGDPPAPWHAGDRSLP
jgi:hypothetical protein